DHVATTARRPRAHRNRSARPRESFAPLAADHPAHGGEQRRDPRQRRVADEADRGARPAGHRADQRWCGERRRRPRPAPEEERLVVLAALLWCTSALLASAVAAPLLARRRAASALIYGISLCVSATGLALSAASLLSPASLGATLVLPVGLPWLGAHFRLDALAAFFLVVI